MLILKAYINNREIDEIHIQNTGEIKNDKTKYLIRKPKCDIPIFHKRSDGYRLLLIKALKILEKEYA